jgi:trimeric autotransporter adhesin
MKTIRTFNSLSIFKKNMLLLFSFLILYIPSFSQVGVQLLAAYTMANGNPIDCTNPGDQTIILTGGNNFLITDIVLDSASNAGSNWDDAANIQLWSGTGETGIEYAVCPNYNVQQLGAYTDFLNCFYLSQSSLQMVNLINTSGVQMITGNTIYLSLGTPNVAAQTVDMHIYGYVLSDNPSSSGNAWSLSGNGGTPPGSNFIGTTDNEGLMFKVHGGQSAYFDNMGNYVFGSGLPSNISGSQNLAYGASTLNDNTYGSNNNAIGSYSMLGNTTGDYNNSFGYSALIYDEYGSSNLALGNYAGENNKGSRNVFLGDSAGIRYTSSNDKLVIGNNKNSELITGDFANDSISLLGTTYVGKPTHISSSYLLAVAGNISSDDDFYSMGVNIGSDEKLKTNIQPLQTNALSKILELNSKTYEYDKTINPHAPEGEQIGFLAQELDEVLPELITKGGKYDYINYIGLIPVITQAMKEQQKTIDSLRNERNPSGAMKEQQNTIDSLRNQLNTMQACVSSLCTALQNSNNNITDSPESTQQVTLISINQPILYQNSPNPFSTGGTKINYFLPQGTMGATIMFFDNYGNKLKEVELSQTGSMGTLNIDATQMSNGIYSYSLVINGQIIDTKKMELAK